MKIDKIDRAIMYELDKNARATLREISKAIGSKEDTVGYRYKKLLESGILHKFVTIFSLDHLGLNDYKIYFQLQGMSKEKYQELLTHIRNDPYTTWAISCDGRWDLISTHYAKNIHQFAEIKSNIFQHFGKYIQDYAVSVHDEAYLFARDHLSTKRSKRALRAYVKPASALDLTDQEKKLVIALANNARTPILELAKQVDLDIKTIKSKLKNYRGTGFIQGHATFFDFSQLDMQSFMIFIYVKETSSVQTNKLLTYCSQLPNVSRLIKTVGAWELELLVEAADPRDIHEMIRELRDMFSENIRKIESVVVSSEIKLSFSQQLLS